MQVGSLLFRVGARQATSSTREKLNEPATSSKNEDFEGVFRTDFGLGFKFGSVMLDGLIERDFLRDGPHFIAEAAAGGAFSRSSASPTISAIEKEVRLVRHQVATEDVQA